MKTTRHLIACICFIVLVIPFSAHADDTAVYDISQDVKPNVLIIFDNSISMSEGLPYDDSTPYSGSYTSDTIYERSCTLWNRWHTYCYNYAWTVSSMTLATFEAGDADDNGIYDSDSGIKKGNRLNFEDSTPGNKLNVAKTVTKQIIDDTYEHVRLGIMLLHGDVGWDTNPGYHTNFPGYHKDNTVFSPTNGASPIQQWDDDGGATDKDVLKGYVNLQTASGATPLAVRLINAAQYFKHEDSATFGNFGAAGGFADPITPDTWCRKNYVIIVTDGLPTYEGDTTSYSDDAAGEFDYIENFLPYRGETIKWNYDYDASTNPSDVDPGDYSSIAPGGGSNYLDDVAKYLYDTDLRPEPSIPGKQNITTFTIGFTVADNLLEDTAENGHGTYQTASSATALEQALRNAMGIIIDRAQTFTAPVVPVQRTTSGDKMYISLFTPRSSDNFWPGYLIKLKIGSNGDLTGFSDGYGGSTETVVTDSNGTLEEDLLRSNQAPYPYWDAQYELTQRSTDRHIYTYLGTSLDLNDASNAFNTTNIDATMLDNPTEGSTPVADLINYICGKDAYDEDEDSVVDEKRIEILGDILHSKPLIIDYEASNPTNPQRVIYVGTNEGMLHAFDDSDGSEKWAFIPPDLLPKLKNIVEGTGHQYYVDGSPQAYILDGNGDGDLLDVGIDQVIIVFGERRGGTSYCALDVSNPDDPQFLWRIDNTDTSGTFGIPAPDLEITELGQSWSEPLIGKVKVGGTVKNVAIIGGGYWPDEQSKGKALYLIDVTNGSLLKSFTNSDHTNLTYSIPSTVLAVDTTFDGYINRVYVGDLGGQMWRFGNQDPAASEDGEINNWTARRLFASSLPSPKIFYPPDMVIEPGYTYLYFGTGDRTVPMSMTETNRFYAVKDRDESDTDFQDRVGVLTESHLVDLTVDLIQEGTTEEADNTYSALDAGDGWYIDMENTGEKVLAPPTVIFGMVLFTTFIPVDTVSNPCSYGGDARLYVVDYLTAVSVIDWDGDTDLEKSDRSLHLGQGIPTEVVITITDTGAVRGYVGAGGGIIHWDFTSNASGFSIDSWRENF
jgi:type IV pilus assembly protein PilY1